MFAWERRRLEKQEEEAAKVKVQVPVQRSQDIFESGLPKPYASPVVPSSAFHIRNRLLSKMGTKVTNSECNRYSLYIRLEQTFINACEHTFTHTHTHSHTHTLTDSRSRCIDQSPSDELRSCRVL